MSASDSNPNDDQERLDEEGNALADWADYLIETGRIYQ